MTGKGCDRYLSILLGDSLLSYLLRLQATAEDHCTATVRRARPEIDPRCLYSMYLEGEGLEESLLRLRLYSRSRSLLLEADRDLAIDTDSTRAATTLVH